MGAQEQARSVKRTARLAGLLYLVVFVLGVFGELFVRQPIIVAGDGAATASNIMASESLWRLGLVTDLIRQAVLVLLPLVLYRLLSPVDRDLAGVMAALALVAVSIGMLNLLNQAGALLSLKGADQLAAAEADHSVAHMMLFLELHRHGGFIAQFLGLWLIPQGYLVFKSGFLPRVLGVLLMVAGLGYGLDAVMFFLFPGLGVTVSLFTFLGEVLFMLWLLIKGVNVERSEARALEAG